MTALRAAPVVFDFTVNDHEPDPVRVPPDAVIQDGTPLADQVQVLMVLTVRLPLMPSIGARTLPGVTV